MVSKEAEKSEGRKKEQPSALGCFYAEGIGLHQL